MLKPFFLFILVQNLLATPSWYHNLDQQTSSYYIGYGQGKSESAAKRRALDDIASQISITIDNTLIRKTGIRSGETYRNVDNTTLQTFHAKLDGVKVIKLEFQEGVYFVALEYENIPNIDKFNKRVSAYIDEDKDVQNHYLRQTSIAKEVAKGIDFSLKRKDKVWYIHCKDMLQALDRRDFSLFFTSTKHPELSISSNKYNNILYDGDEFYFKVKSAKKGYITLFAVYEDGTVTTLMANTPIQKDKSTNIPSMDYDSFFKAGLMYKEKETFDLYVAFFSEEQKYFDQFAKADETLISDERFKNFDQLIELMDAMTYATLKITTKPR